MDIQDFYIQARNAITNEHFEALSSLELERPEYFNWVMDVFYALNVKQFPGSRALIWRYNEKERVYTFEDIYRKANQFLNFLQGKGIKQGDCIFSQLPLDPANWISLLGAIKGGLVLIPSSTNLTEKDIEYRFNTIFPEVVIADLANAPKLDAAERLVNRSIKLKILVDGEAAGWHNIEEIFKEPKEAAAAITRADDNLFYFFTSGTTGLPKIVTHTHLTLPFGHLTTSAWIGLRHGDIHYNISAPGWAKFAYSSFFGPWNLGATILANQTDKFVAREQLQTIEQYGVTTFCAPPTVLRLMIQEDLSGYKFQLRQCVAAGEPLNPEIIEQWKQGTGLVIRDGYGQTESSLLAGNMPGATVRFGSMGKPCFLYDLVIANDDGQEMPQLEEGNICVRMEGAKTNGIFTGYLGEPERNNRVFKHGLYYTGDKAYKDEEGYIWFVGRDDDVIKASDYRIGPFEVESILLEHELVVEAAVVASPHAIRGFAVKAFVIMRPGETPCKVLADDLFGYCNKHLATYKIPRIIEFVETLPKTISGKIRRVELRAAEADSKSKKELRENEFFHEKY
ncbi:MAG: AMP-binding protein [Chitinophagaceae bacterium]|nr:AMP-binding protein [Chitinophagaceae bacterium]